MDAVAARFASAWADVSQGREAEDKKDPEGARVAYQAALGLDQDKAMARAGLDRVTGTPPAEPPPLPALPEAAQGTSIVSIPGVVVALLAVVVALLVIVVIGLAWLLRRATRAPEAPSPSPVVPAPVVTHDGPGLTALHTDIKRIAEGQDEVLSRLELVADQLDTAARGRREHRHYGTEEPAG
ncbi:hypothetical protein ACFQH9_06495 [Pseudonocardia lutea]|uniref:Tetratricopeptide repeat protein n=1 Tax=Pseudonocardia lutea TaxID=2172015 RepID=A0ABW1I5D9_9PSEU